MSIIGTIRDAITGIVANVKNNVNTTNNELLVNLEGHQCPGNTTVEQLAPDAVFTGSTWQDTLDYGVLSINIATDVDSATDGLDIQWSSDGVNVSDHDYFTILADVPKTFTFGPAQRYYRIVYTNGSDDTTTTFHLTSLLRKCYVKPSSHRITDAIVGQDDAELVKSVITGERDDGVFGNATISNSNRLKTVSQPYTYAIAEGDVEGHLPVRRFGHNPSVGTSIETVDATSDLYVDLTSAEILKVVSTSANDTSAGTGMQSVFIQGLDTNYALQSEVVSLNGTTAVNTTKSYIRVLAFYGQTVGTTAANEGIIDITNNAGTNVLCRMPVGEGRCNAAIFTVPAGYNFYMTSWYGSENSSKGSDITLWKREFGDGGWQMIRLFTILDNVFDTEIQSPLRFTEKIDIQIRAKATLAGANVAAGFYGWMESE